MKTHLELIYSSQDKFECRFGVQTANRRYADGKCMYNNANDQALWSGWQNALGYALDHSDLRLHLEDQ